MSRYFAEIRVPPFTKGKRENRNVLIFDLERTVCTTLLGEPGGQLTDVKLGTCMFVTLTAQKPQFLGLRKNVGNLVQLSLQQVPITARGLCLPYSYSAMGCLIKFLSSKPKSSSSLK